eukprot:scaffold2236_cov385-Prasinococcus_capsulatus_cf.AAC.8
MCAVGEELSLQRRRAPPSASDRHLADAGPSGRHSDELRTLAGQCTEGGDLVPVAVASALARRGRCALGRSRRQEGRTFVEVWQGAPLQPERRGAARSRRVTHSQYTHEGAPRGRAPAF